MDALLVSGIALSRFFQFSVFAAFAFSVGFSKVGMSVLTISSHYVRNGFIASGAEIGMGERRAVVASIKLIHCQFNFLCPNQCRARFYLESIGLTASLPNILGRIHNLIATRLPSTSAHTIAATVHFEQTSMRRLAQQ
jgi:hypothetical protein